LVKTYHDRAEESTKRLQLRSTAHTFTRIISEGTNCSSFEASIITEKAQEVFQLGVYEERQALRPGQMIWQAIEENEPPGKPLRECRFKRIRLTVLAIEEDLEVLRNHGHSAKRGQQILRMTQEAVDQGALLTQEDLAMLLDSDVKTIRTDIKRYQQKHGIVVPTRGNKKDIGPGLTHRDRAVELFIQGKDAVAIARDLNHSLKAVERYVQSFCRVGYCQAQLRNTLKTALVVGVSVAAVNRYLGLKDRYWGTPEYRERLEEIEKVGSQFWAYQDAKKKPGRKPRRRT
jgi:translation elongation factor EF-1beta